MGRKKRTASMYVKRFLMNELAEYYGLNRNTIRKRLLGIDLYTVKGAIEAIRILDDKRRID